MTITKSQGLPPPPQPLTNSSGSKSAHSHSHHHQSHRMLSHHKSHHSHQSSSTVTTPPATEATDDESPSKYYENFQSYFAFEYCYLYVGEGKKRFSVAFELDSNCLGINDHSEEFLGISEIIPKLQNDSIIQ